MGRGCLLNLYHGWVAWQTVVTGGNPSHFTLPLIEVKTKKIAGYVHATCRKYSGYQGILLCEKVAKSMTYISLAKAVGP